MTVGLASPDPTRDSTRSIHLRFLGGRVALRDKPPSVCGLGCVSARVLSLACLVTW